MTEHPIVPLELPKDRIRPKNRPGKNPNAGGSRIFGVGKYFHSKNSRPDEVGDCLYDICWAKRIDCCLIGS